MFRSPGNEGEISLPPLPQSRSGARAPADLLGTVAGAIGHTVSGWPAEISRGVDTNTANDGAAAAHFLCDRLTDCTLLALGPLAGVFGNEDGDPVKSPCKVEPAGRRMVLRLRRVSTKSE